MPGDSLVYTNKKSWFGKVEQKVIFCEVIQWGIYQKMSFDKNE